MFDSYKLKEKDLDLNLRDSYAHNWLNSILRNHLQCGPICCLRKIWMQVFANKEKLEKLRFKALSRWLQMYSFKCLHYLLNYWCAKDNYHFNPYIKTPSVMKTTMHWIRLAIDWLLYQNPVELGWRRSGQLFFMSSMMSWRRWT